jgi:endonuclease YncB( thermonuclease family)
MLAAVFIVIGRADSSIGRVVKIADGDILTVLEAKFQQHKIRLGGIDAPEREQPFGAHSQQHLGAAVVGPRVTMESDEQDRYSRTLGQAFSERPGHKLEAGSGDFAWHYKTYQADQVPSDREHYAAAEIYARNARVGKAGPARHIPRGTGTKACVTRR